MSKATPLFTFDSNRKAVFSKDLTFKEAEALKNWLLAKGIIDVHGRRKEGIKPERPINTSVFEEAEIIE